MTNPVTNSITQLVQVFLPKSLYPKAKAVVAGVLAVCTALGTILPLVSGAPQWLSVVLGAVLAAATQLSVYFTGNENAPQPQHEAGAGVTAVD